MERARTMTAIVTSLRTMRLPIAVRLIGILVEPRPSQSALLSQEPRDLPPYFPPCLWCPWIGECISERGSWGTNPVSPPSPEGGDQLLLTVWQPVPVKE